MSLCIATLACVLTAAVLLPQQARAQVSVDIESGLAFSGYNDVQVPRETGTRFSLSEDLEVDRSPFLRLRMEWDLNERHTLGLLYAPLTLDASGSVPSPLVFEGVTFPASSPLDAFYTFNSYRLTWRYNLRTHEGFRAGMGLTAKIRDAAIRIEGGGLESEKTNVGFVPLLHFLAAWELADTLDLLLTGDALAAPQGRAEDVFAGIKIRSGGGPFKTLLADSGTVEYRLGYRIVEGGANVAEVYNFALIHYVSLGVRVSF
ncbi:MAG: hypothetical protein R6W82_08355 [bacterium]